MTLAATYSLRITQGALQITDKISAGITEIHAVVGGARTCSYAYTVAGDGTIDPGALIDSDVVIEIDGGSGFVAVFTGKIKRQPVYDTSTRVMSVTATDGWQEYLDDQDEAALQALIPTALPYNVDIDGPRESGMQQATALLQTTRMDAFLDAVGAFQLTLWEPAMPGSEDRVVLPSEVRNVRPELAPADELQNKIEILYEHVFTRRIHWRATFQWIFGNGDFLDPWPSWCDWYTSTDIYSGHDLPRQSEIQAAAEGTGWGVDGSISFDGHPETFGPGAGEPCGPDIGWVLSDYYRTEAIAATWTGGKTFSVEARETLTLVVQNSSSIAKYGEKPGELQYNVSTEYDAAAVDSDNSPARPENFTDYGAGGTQSYSDEIDLAQRTAAIEYGLAKADWIAAETHRRNHTRFEVLVDPALELGDTWTINHPLATMRGVMTEFTHRISSSQATTEVRITEYEAGGGSTTALLAPAMTVQDPAESAPPITFVQNKIGGQPESDIYDPAWEEQSIFTANVYPVCVPPDCADQNQFYPVAFRVRGPDISEEAREAEEMAASYTYEIAFPGTTLSLVG